MVERNSVMKLSVNKILAKLAAEKALDAISFRGYIGPSPGGETVTLYQSLDDLSEHLEIARDDIIEVAELPESSMPLGGVIIWVRREARIIRRHLKDDSGIREAGRLRMKVREPNDDASQGIHHNCVP